MKLSRRTFFLQSALAALSTASVPMLARKARNSASPANSFSPPPNINSSSRGYQRTDGYILPPSLQGGMTVGITAPASGANKGELESGIEFLKSLGMNIVLGKCLYRNNGFLSAPDDQRAAEFMEFVTRPDIDAIMCARGGYGVMRMLNMLNFETIRNNPKIIMGYSDITALLIAILNKSKVVTYHGPVCSSDFDTVTSDSFIKMVIGNKAERLPSREDTAEEIVYSNEEYDIIAPGSAKGRITGGNLTMVCSTLGTPYEIDTTDSILFLEDVSEEPYKIDRMLTQLWLAGKLDRVKGVILGVFKNCDPYKRPDKLKDELSMGLREVFESRLGSFAIPVMAGLPIGHVRSKLTMPLGVMAAMNTQDASFRILEPSVA